jgi:hypothetical protein
VRQQEPVLQSLKWQQCYGNYNTNHVEIGKVLFWQMQTIGQGHFAMRNQWVGEI